jgi:hypothetical protein
LTEMLKVGGGQLVRPQGQGQVEVGSCVSHPQKRIFRIAETSLKKFVSIESFKT